MVHCINVQDHLVSIQGCVNYLTLQMRRCLWMLVHRTIVLLLSRKAGLDQAVSCIINDMINKFHSGIFRNTTMMFCSSVARYIFKQHVIMPIITSQTKILSIKCNLGIVIKTQNLGQWWKKTSLLCGLRAIQALARHWGQLPQCSHTYRNFHTRAQITFKASWVECCGRRCFWQAVQLGAWPHVVLC